MPNETTLSKDGGGRINPTPPPPPRFALFIQLLTLAGIFYLIAESLKNKKQSNVLNEEFSNNFSGNRT